MKIKKIFIGRRPARETPRDQGGGRAQRHSCQELTDVDGEKMSRPLKFGGLHYRWMGCTLTIIPPPRL